MEVNRIYNQDCIEWMQAAEPQSVDVILTSPPYNTSRRGSSLTGACANVRYDEYNDRKSDEEYIDWTLRIFEGFDRVLVKDGCVLYNLSYSAENTWLMWNVVSEIQRKTNFIVADCLVWKKTTTSPNSCSPNKLTRICEFVFVFCRKSEFATFKTNKKVTTHRVSGQANYENIFNLIEAPNNDGSNDIHKATFSTVLCRRLLAIYARGGVIVYDPFMGTGTTAIACIKDKYQYVGTEISKRYCDYAQQRIDLEQMQLTLF